MMRAREKDRQKKRGEEGERGGRERERESTFVKCLNVKTIHEKIEKVN
jgi:hypothetical protein